MLGVICQSLEELSYHKSLQGVEQKKIEKTMGRLSANLKYVVEIIIPFTLRLSFNTDLKELTSDTALKMYLDMARDLQPLEGNVVPNYNSTHSMVEWNQEKEHYNSKKVEALETHTEQLTKRLKATLL